VSVNPEIVTVGVLVAEPIVTTGPPPRITVRPGPAPARLTLASNVTPPANVPEPIRIVEPSGAAFTAA
jgi:hypothetical protein